MSSDPLYLFTQQPVDEMLTTMLRNAISPLLNYAQEMYSPPLSINGFLPNLHFDHIVSKEALSRRIAISAHNFVYQSIKKQDSKRTLAYGTLAKISAKKRHVADGYNCTLKVFVPRSKDHEFWSRQTHGDLQVEDANNFTWDMVGDAESFEVKKWGYSELTAQLYATHRAKDIIRHIRRLLTSAVAPSPH